MVLDFRTALHAEECICGILVVALRAAHPGLCRQLVEQGFRFLQIPRVEAFRKPVVDFAQRRAGFATPALASEQPCKAHFCSQF